MLETGSSPALAAPLIPLGQCVGNVPPLILQVIRGLENGLEGIRISHELADILIAMFVSSCSPKSLGARQRAICQRGVWDGAFSTCGAARAPGEQAESLTHLIQP